MNTPSLSLLLLFTVIAAHAAPPAATPPSLPPLDPVRVAELTAQNTGAPVHFTPPFSDRAFWDRQAALPANAKAVAALFAQADAMAAQPTPQLTRELYDEFLKTGERKGYEKPFGLRTERLGAFVFAEGLRNDGHYLPLIEAELAALLDEPSWASPAHAHGRLTWEQAHDNVELAASMRAWSIATADYLIGDKLAASTRARIRAEIHAHVLDPFMDRVRGGGKTPFAWMVSGINNWNGVCNAGVLGAELALADTPAAHAVAIAAFEASTRLYIDNYTDDGFCAEGLGYWSYGFGHYMMGAELIRLATGGRDDLLRADPKIARIANFPQRWEIANGIYPAFGDAGVGIYQRRPALYADFAALRLGQGVETAFPLSFLHRHPLGGMLYQTLFDLALPRPAADAVQAPQKLPLRDWFSENGALVCRRSPAFEGLAVAFKGGSNTGGHHHNDLGSFVVVNNGVLVLTDLGMDTYVKDTFGPKRFTSEMMNSFGHPVPRVAGELQRTGAEAQAVTLRTEFTDERDVWEIDLTSAYDVPALEKLTRTFIFTRADGGRLEIVDHVRFSSPQTFGTAIALLQEQKAQHIGDQLLRVRSNRLMSVDGKSASIDIAVSSGEDAPLKIGEDPIHGIVPNRPPRGTRVGIDLAAPAREATIRLTITPSPAGQPASAGHP